ncbi:hypothetical protein ACJ73_05186 [Blastomyces percursus]|uniref:Uncharacterized protein n=1 Tax=Blastomyces percursus TaxID=1658174 RepID=A0A1J9Q467_9EURO|nr:hypothetical protein ACJ73_05186 [Blastomyces percursus]
MALKTLFDICAQLKSLLSGILRWLKSSLLQREQAVDEVRPDSFLAWDKDVELSPPTQATYSKAGAIIHQDLSSYLAPLKARPTSIDEGDKGKLYSCNTTPPLPPLK